MPPELPAPARADRLLVAGVFVLTALVFLPLSLWLLRHTVGQEQLLHAFLVLGFAGALLLYRRGVALRPRWDFSPLAQYLLLAAYALLLATWWLRTPLPLLIAYCLALAAALLWVFGRARVRAVGSLIGAFAVFVAAALLLPTFDWPLRALAGGWSATFLRLIGDATQLVLIKSTTGPLLILYVEGRPFEVAAECNGFGLLTSSVLMAVLLVLYRPLELHRRIAALLLAAGAGFLFNVLRIVVIVKLAPLLADSHYMLMHEVVGTAATYACLILLWVLLAPPSASPPAERERSAGGLMTND
jgi:exosortase/archaeosortase family protein